MSKDGYWFGVALFIFGVAIVVGSLLLMASPPAPPAPDAPQALIIEYCARTDEKSGQRLTDCLSSYGLMIVNDNRGE